MKQFLTDKVVKLFSFDGKMKVCNNRGNLRGAKIFINNDLVPKEGSI